MAVALGTLAVVVSSCGQPSLMATVDGFEVQRTTVESLHPDGYQLTAEEQASSLFLLILHHLVVDGADNEFDVTASDEEIRAAFDERTSRFANGVESGLDARGVSRDRVMLEAELDVIRGRLQSEFIRRGGPGVDLAAAHRRFLSANSLVCMTMLAPSGPELDDRITAMSDEGVTLDEMRAELGDGVEEVDLGCAAPVNHPEPVAPVALDGEVGRAYARRFSDGTLYVVAVTSRDAPALEDVLDEVTAIAEDTQGRDLFDAWVIGLLQSADVVVAPEVGRWEATEETNGTPTVLPPS